MTFRVRDVDGNMSDLEIEAHDHDDAGAMAMQYWYDGGSFAGDPMPSEMSLIVTGKDDVEHIVAVAVDWSPDFYAVDVTDKDGSCCPVPRSTTFDAPNMHSGPPNAANTPNDDGVLTIGFDGFRIVKDSP